MPRGVVILHAVAFHCLSETFASNPSQKRTQNVIIRICFARIYVVKEAANSIGCKEVIDPPITEITASIILPRSCFVTMV